MAIYHMETEAVREMAKDFHKTIEEMRNQLLSLENFAQSLDWMGESRNQFDAQIHQLVQALIERAEAGTVLSYRADQEVDEWERIIGESRASISAINILGIGAVIGMMSNILGNLMIGRNSIFDAINPHFDSAFTYIRSTRAGRDLLEEATNAHLHFVYRSPKPGGGYTEIDLGGDPNGNVIPITTGTMEENFLGGYSPDDNSITISKDWVDRWLEQKNLGQLSGVLSHEMQHAVDQATILNYGDRSGISQMSPNQLETYLHDEVSQRLLTESRAFPRGEAVQSGFGNIADANLTSTEANTVLFKYGYDAIYEEQYNTLFAENNMPYYTDVWLDSQGNWQISVIKAD